MAMVEQEKARRLNIHKLIIPFYALLCLVEIPLLIKWNGNVTSIYLKGILLAIIAFVFPFIIAGMISFLFSKPGKTSFLILFVNRLSTIILIVASLVLSIWYLIMFNINF
jgi:heme/copper-type cytochrome/quinol oxidase subunit 4